MRMCRAEIVERKSVERKLVQFDSGNYYELLESEMNDLKLLQDVIAFLFHIMHDENTTGEQKQVAEELSERVAQKIAELTRGDSGEST